MGATAPSAGVRAGSDTTAAGLAVSAWLGKGDIAGHEFHGNQWTGGEGGGDTSSAVDTSPRAAISASAFRTAPADIPRAPEGALSPEQRAIETRFAEQIATRGTDSMLREYAAHPDSQGGRVLNTDTMRELSPEYRLDRSQSAAVHEPASYLTKQAFAKALAVPAKPGEFVVFTAGGAGAGKSSAIKQVPEVQSSTDHAYLVYDSNMNDAGKAIQKIDAVTASGRNAIITYVGREPVESLTHGALPRAMGTGGGRVVPLAEHERTHVGSARAVAALAEHYRGNPKVAFQFIDNTNGRGNAKLTDASLTSRMNFDSISTRLKDALDREYAQGHINERVYRGTLGKLLAAIARGLRKAAAQATGRADRQGHGREPELGGISRETVGADLTVRSFLHGA